MIITYIKCVDCYKEFEYSFPIWCFMCKQFISSKRCNKCHVKKYHYEDFHYMTYEERVKRFSA